ncbi:hypothetical protein IJI91_03495 [Candidatus Saccharibacteria bacterium]|nr:hypothetical protein [Candidatus Saccharibacteria bacterium]
MKNQKLGKIIISAGRKPWSHEFRVAEILASTGHRVEFLPEGNLHSADILVNEVEFEIKSPKSSNANSLEHNIKKALRQSKNIIIDTSRIKKVQNDKIRNFLINQMRSRKQIKKLLLVTKQGKVIDISTLI